MKYDIETPATIKKNFESMPLNWNRYCEQLREVDHNLYNLKEQFKMGLLSSTRKPKAEPDEKSDDDLEKDLDMDVDESTSTEQ